MNSFSRRDFFKFSSGVPVAVLLNNCTSLPRSHNLLPVHSYQSNQHYPYIDMHTHIFNARDVYGPAFVERRKIHEWFYLFRKLARSFAEIAIPAASLGNASSPLSERNKIKRLYFDVIEGVYPQKFKLKDRYKKMDDALFCHIAEQNHTGVSWLDDTPIIGGFSGFLSDRLHNAAKLMRVYPKVNIFVNAMVDLFEGRVATKEAMHFLTDIYQDINILSKGRCLPFISFHPERYYKYLVNKETDVQDTWTGEKIIANPIDQIKDAILNKGFIGVKLHPSSAYVPYNNKEYGYYNNSRGGRRLDRCEVHESPCNYIVESEAFDEGLNQLYEFCAQYDVPILTHAGYGLESVDMMSPNTNEPKYTTEEEAVKSWTMDPNRWEEVIQKYSVNGKKLRVALAHFSGGFTSKSKDLPISDSHGLLKSALSTMESLEKNNKTKQCLYMDLSHMTEFFNDTDNRENYRELFHKTLIEHAHLFDDNLLYGSDWHMPEANTMGGAYYDNMEKLIREVSNKVSTIKTENIFGKNSTKFLGLHKGQKNRERLEAFYTNNGIDLNQVHWIRAYPNLNEAM